MSPCIRVPNGIICMAGPIYTEKDDSGKEWCFEFHRYCGPIVIGRDGNPVKNQPISEKHRFWQAFNKWYSRQVAE